MSVSSDASDTATPTASVIRILLDSWGTLLSGSQSLRREWLTRLAERHAVTLSDPTNVEQSRTELILATAQREAFTQEGLAHAERQQILLRRLAAVWNVVWLNLLPGVIVIPWAVNSIPAAAQSEGTTAAVLLSLSTVFLFCILGFLCMLIQSCFLGVYERMVRRILRQGQRVE